MGRLLENNLPDAATRSCSMFCSMFCSMSYSMSCSMCCSIERQYVQLEPVEFDLVALQRDRVGIDQIDPAGVA